MSASSTWSATELVAAYAAGDLSPVEATKDALDRIEQHNDRVNAFCLVDADLALESAKAAEQRWQRGEQAGLVDGVPTSIKDVFLTAGWPTLRGSQTVDSTGEWTEDSPPVARLREHGAVLLGKTTTPEFGWKGVTDAPLTGITRNPWDTARTPGGSSGGASAAATTGMGALHIGTDAGGSVRIPGAFTNTVGFKPTLGTAPHYPPSPFGFLAHTGPITRTVADSALLLDVISGPDHRDGTSLPPPTSSFATGLESGVLGLRVAFSPTLGYAEVDAEVALLVSEAVAVIAELGAEVDEVDPGFDDPIDEFTSLWNASAASVARGLDDEQRAQLDPGFAVIAAEGQSISAADYLAAAGIRSRLSGIMGAFHERYDLLITPTVPIPAFAAGEEVPVGSQEPRWTSWTPFTYPFNITGQPAMSVPCGFTAIGLPVGLQIVGPRFADARVLAAAAVYQRATEWHRRQPPLN